MLVTRTLIPGTCVHSVEHGRPCGQIITIFGRDFGKNGSGLGFCESSVEQPTEPVTRLLAGGGGADSERPPVSIFDPIMTNQLVYNVLSGFGQKCQKCESFQYYY